MLISISNNTCRLVNGTDQDIEWLHSFLSFKDSSAERRRRMGYTVTDDRVRMFSLKTKEFPTGLLYMVRRQAAKLGKDVDLVDTREPIPSISDEVRASLLEPPWTLRDYQMDSIELIENPGKDDYLPGRGILWIPTAGGKSHCVSAIAHAFPGNWAFLVHRSHLADDVDRRWNTLTGGIAGRILSGETNPDPKFTVCTFQTLAARLGTHKAVTNWAKTVTGLLVDECHISAAATAVKVIRQFPNANMRIGVSGTPLDRSDKRSLVAVGLLGPVIQRVKAKTLVDNGTIARPTVRMIPCFQLSHLDTWAEVYEQLIVHSHERNGIIVREMLKAERPGMVFVQRLQHGLILKKLAEKAGLTVDFVNGDKDARQRDQAIKRLSMARTDFIIATDVFNEGVNIPDLRSVILAAGGKSVSKVLQQIGRALRKADGKTEATIVDIADQGNDWLAKHAAARVAACRREGYEVVQG